MFFDFVFYLTKKGKEFKAACDYVHTVAEEIIEKRRKTLVCESCLKEGSEK